jgi:hypothetical protein
MFYVKGECTVSVYYYFVFRLVSVYCYLYTVYYILMGELLGSGVIISSLDSKLLAISTH